MTNCRQLIIFSIFLLATWNLYAQNDDSKKMEREIKISGNFYYGDGSGTDENDAKKLAIEELKLMISDNIRGSDSNVTTIDFNGFENNIGTITIPLEGRVRVIAFLQRKEVKVNPVGERKLMVIRLTPDGPSLVGDAVRDDSLQVDGGNPVVAVEKKEETVCHADSAAKREIATLPADSTMKTEPTTPTSQTVNTPQTQNNSSSTVPEVADQTINSLSKLTSSKDVGDFLNEHKLKGKLMFGRLYTLQNPDKCYFVILKDGKLIDVLDKLASSLRIGLISGNHIDYKRVQDTIYWIYIVEN